MDINFKLVYNISTLIVFIIALVVSILRYLESKESIALAGIIISSIATFFLGFMLVSLLVSQFDKHKKSGENHGKKSRTNK